MKQLLRTLLPALGLATACQAPSGSEPQANGQEANGNAPDRSDQKVVRASVKRVEAEIDFSNSATIAEQVEKLASALEDASLVRLSLTIVPEGERDPDYRVTETPRGGAPRPLACDSGQRLEGTSYSFTFNPDYNHLLLEILHGPPDSAPYSTAACAYRGGAGIPAFKIEGYYWVSAVSIPTASDLQLRPVSPTFGD